MSQAALDRNWSRARVCGDDRLFRSVRRLCDRCWLVFGNNLRATSGRPLWSLSPHLMFAREPGSKPAMLIEHLPLYRDHHGGAVRVRVHRRREQPLARFHNRGPLRYSRTSVPMPSRHLASLGLGLRNQIVSLFRDGGRLGYCRKDGVGHFRRGFIKIGRRQSIRLRERRSVVDQWIRQRGENRSRLTTHRACADVAPQGKEDAQRDQADQREPNRSRHPGPHIRATRGTFKDCLKFASGVRPVFSRIPTGEHFF